MSHLLPPYPNYRVPDVDWLGYIPKHWRLQRLRSIADLAASNVDKIRNEGDLDDRQHIYTEMAKRIWNPDDLLQGGRV